MTTYSIKSIKGTKTVNGTLGEAIAAAKRHNEKFQPAYGTQVEDEDGETVWDSEDAATPYGYAAIGDDGNRPVVWGLGRTEEEAEEEARIQLVELGEDSNVDRVVPVNEAQWDRINGGDVSAEGL